MFGKDVDSTNKFPQERLLLGATPGFSGTSKQPVVASDQLKASVLLAFPTCPKYLYLQSVATLSAVNCIYLSNKIVMSGTPTPASLSLTSDTLTVTSNPVCLSTNWEVPSIS